MAQFITQSYILSIVGAANSDLGLTAAHIPDALIQAASQEVIERTGYDWVKKSGHTYILDGNGTIDIIVPEAPIVALDQIKIYNADRSEYENISSASDFSAKIVIDYDAGRIETIPAANWTVASAIFLKGFQNIEITGDFGIEGTVHPLIKHITMLIVMRNLQTMNPQMFKFDIIRERLGRYEYQTSTSGVSEKNEKLSIDGQINMLIDEIDKRDKFYIGET